MMTRQIKFRGKDIETGEWRFGGYYFNPVCNRHFILGRDTVHGGLFKEVDPKTVGQFTGMLDKNGNEIFEGDIFPCVYAFDGCTEHVMHIEYNIARAGFFPLWDYAKCHQKGVTKSMNDLTRLAILGNIHDNPELCQN